MVTEDQDRFTEEKMTFAEELVGILTYPKREGVIPALLMLHGFASNKDEAGNLFRQMARELAGAGIASFRFDFRGWGESVGEMADTTFAGLIADGEAAYQFIATRDFIDPRKLGILGFSLGGGVAIALAGLHPDWFRSLASWSSVGDPVTDFTRLLGHSTFDRAAREGIVRLNLGWREVSLKAGFFDSLSQYHLKELISDYQGAFLAIAGEDDFAATHVPALIANAAGQRKESWIVEGANHTFNALTGELAAAEAVIARTVNFFRETLIY